MPANRHDDLPRPTSEPLPPDPARVRAQRAAGRARRRGRLAALYALLAQMFHINTGDFLAFLQAGAKWLLLGSAVGVAAGAASAIFLYALAWATAYRLQHPWLLWLLPLAGFGMGWLYYRYGGLAAQGNNLVIDEVNSNRSRIPLRMAPMVLLGTIGPHLFGGSAGREGTAIQMGASLADSLRRLLRLQLADRRYILMAGISGGFGSVFGVPAAGAIFGMEVQSMGRVRYDGLIPCLVAAYVGDLVTRAWGAPHAYYAHLPALAIEPLLVIKVIVAGILFGLTSLLFIELTHGIKFIYLNLTPYTPLYPLAGGVAIILLTVGTGSRDYLGLSLPLIDAALSGAEVATFAFLLKLLFTAVTLGSGYLGGEVTPLFVVGATLGHTLGNLLGVDPTLLAAIGFVAVFAGASNTPLACTIMGIELFGGGGALYIFLGCAIAYLASGHRGIYVTQMVGAPKSFALQVADSETLRTLAARRPGPWLPGLPALTGAPEHRLVRSVMSAHPVHILDSATVTTLVDVAVEAGVRTLPVVDSGGRLTGIVTDRDLARAGAAVSLSHLRALPAQERDGLLTELAMQPVAAIMTTPVHTVGHTATLKDALLQLNRHKLKRLPVVDQVGHLVGIITRSDILREFTFFFATQRTAGDREAWQLPTGSLPLEPMLTAPASTPLRVLLQLLQDDQLQRALLLDPDGQPAGFLSPLDLHTRLPSPLRTFSFEQLIAHPDPLLDQMAAEFMTAPPLSVTASTPILSAAHLLLESQIKTLPVIDETTGQMLGTLSRKLLLNVMTENLIAPDPSRSGRN
jgi:H+/Cl- antiporter ClcA/CBS domain-containing protein